MRRKRAARKGQPYAFRGIVRKLSFDDYERACEICDADPDDLLRATTESDVNRFVQTTRPIAVGDGDEFLRLVFVNGDEIRVKDFATVDAAREFLEVVKADFLLRSVLNSRMVQSAYKGFSRKSALSRHVAAGTTRVSEALRLATIFKNTGPSPQA